MKQKTIAQPVAFEGVGLHSGKTLHVSLLPAPEGSGIRFRRTDFSPAVEIQALATHVGDTSRSTSVRDAETGTSVGTIEHLMAALAATGVCNLCIETDGEEFPILDGCSEQLLHYLHQAGIQEQKAERKRLILGEELHYHHDNGAELHAYPSDTFEMEVTVDYHTEVLGRQTAKLHSLEDVETGFAVCRTFCFLHEIWPLIQHNLARGGSLDNAIVYVAQPLKEEEQRKIAEFFHVENIRVNESGILSNNRLRFDNEAARHKLLDVLGDLQLIGTDLQARIVAVCPGHAANTRMAQEIYRWMQQHPENLR
ncbi:MAG: UDP-3-O-acyl-N-acetylglucosamine deacetylase [Bacteroidales bacterium]|nr:UDP-3-O-acyl-N-acetylglucosamine deacetylase [Bacteroidales bacterium]